jgi:hypothetical protein
LTAVELLCYAEDPEEERSEGLGSTCPSKTPLGRYSMSLAEPGVVLEWKSIARAGGENLTTEKSLWEVDEIGKKKGSKMALEN